MTNHQKGCRRDRLVLDTLQEWGTMDTEQIRLLFFPSARVAQRRLKIMTVKGRLHRTREAIELPYSYCIKQFNRERLALNWIRIWLIKRLKSWDVLESFDYGTNSCIIRNTATNKVRTHNVFYNVFHKTWISGEVFVIYDTDEQVKEAAKRIKGTLKTIDGIRRELLCEKCC